MRAAAIRLDCFLASRLGASPLGRLGALGLSNRQ